MNTKTDCRTCDHYVKLDAGGEYNIMCGAPQLLDVVDPQGPNAPPHLVRCNETRTFAAACGAAARWFVPIGDDKPAGVMRFAWPGTC